MLRIPHLRVILETVPNSGDWNMSVDEALLETAIGKDVATLRFYQWSEPTVSLGYFQKSSDFLNDANLAKLPVVRRLSGGGAILHDDELTLSVALPSSQRLFAQPQELYDIVHGSIAASLNQLGFPVKVRGETDKRPVEPLLCFQRKDSHDITLSDQKILGSAQRRRRGSILQHSSLMRRASRLANQVPGLVDLCSAPIPENLSEILASRLADSIAETWSFGSLTESEIEVSKKLCERSASIEPV